jgi:zinc protease
MLLYGPTTPYGHPIRGVEAALEGLAPEELRAHFRAHYGPSTTTLLVVGDVSADEVTSRAEALLGDWPSVAPPTRVDVDGAAESSLSQTTLFLLDKPGAAQSVIRAGHLSVPRTHPDYYPLSLLNHAFGGEFTARLMQNLRQAKGYSYGYRSWIEWHRASSALLAGGGVQTDKTGPSVVETLQEFADIRESRPVSAEELEDGQAGILRGLPQSFETSQQLLGHMAELVLFDLPDTYYSTFAAHIEATSLADVHRVATERLDTQRLVVLVVGDREIAEPQLQELGLPLVHVDAEGTRIK